MKLRAVLLLGWLGISGCADDPALGIGDERIDANESEIEAELITLTKRITAERRDESGQRLMHRFNQPKSVACLDADMVVEDLPEELAIGLFGAPGIYPAKLRFANATQFDDREADLRGLSVKVSDVPGAVSVGGETGVQDFTFNNYPALFAGTPEDFLAFVRATANGRTWLYFVNPIDPHLGSLSIVLRARSRPDSPFAERYFSTTPYRFGDGNAVKYSVQSCEALPPTPPADDPDYLRDAVRETLRSAPVCLAFMVQFQTDSERMPIEDASVIWPEELSPFRKVAEIRVPEQTFDDDARMSECEAMQFNPWNGLDEHRPLGGINRVRQQLYEELGEFRATQNASSQ